MPPTVPEPLATIAERLQCPVCRHPLAAAAGSLICPAGHRYDVARQGYVTLQSPSRRPFTGDDARMVAARVAVQEAGFFRPLTTALAHEAGRMGGPGLSLILDVGAGTGHHLAGVLARTAHARGVALDASRPASQLAARAHPSIAAVRADVWQRIPLRDGSVDLALSVFAPRNGSELARVLRPGGTLIVVTPAPEHLHQLAPLHTVRVDPRKAARVRRQLAEGLRPGAVDRVTWTLELTRNEVDAVLCMGPAGRHLRADIESRLAALDEPAIVTAAVDLRTFLRPGQSVLSSVPAERSVLRYNALHGSANQPSPTRSHPRETRHPGPQPQRRATHARPTLRRGRAQNR